MVVHLPAAGAPVPVRGSSISAELLLPDSVQPPTATTQPQPTSHVSHVPSEIHVITRIMHAYTAHLGYSTAVPPLGQHAPCTPAPPRLFRVKHLHQGAPGVNERIPYPHQSSLV